MTLSTCSENVKYDSVIEVGNGECDKLTCLETVEKPTCSRGDIKVINAVANTEYKVLVGAKWAGTTNQFEFVAYSDAKPENSKCDKPVDVPMNKKIYRVNTYTGNGYTTRMTFGSGIEQDVIGHYYRIPKGYSGKVRFMTCATGTTIPTFVSLHASCSYDQNTQISTPTPINNITYSDYTVGRCGNYGSYLEVDIDGQNDIIAFFGNAKQNDTGFIDVEIFMQVTSLNPDEDNKSSTAPSTPSEASKNDNDNDNNSGNKEDETESNTGIIIGVVFGIIGVIAIAIIIAIIVFCCKKRTNTGGFSETTYLSLGQMNK